MEFFLAILNGRSLLVSLTQRELKSRYAGSFLGLLWALIHPLAMIAIFWFVFSIGFKTQPLQEVPFVVWLTTGLAPWFLFAEIMNTSAGAVVDNGQLLKKTVFPPQILPLVKVSAALFSHTFFLMLVIALLLVCQIPLSLYSFQSIYYSLALVVLSMGLAWLVSALNVFVRDVSQVVSLVVQVWFWVTPVFWDISIMPSEVQWYLRLNPMYYVVEGYRESFLQSEGFWRNGSISLYYWTCAIASFGLGAYVFRRLKPQFCDVL